MSIHFIAHFDQSRRSQFSLWRAYFACFCFSMVFNACFIIDKKGINSYWRKKMTRKCLFNKFVLTNSSMFQLMFRFQKIVKYLEYELRIRYTHKHTHTNICTQTYAYKLLHNYTHINLHPFTYTNTKKHAKPKHNQTYAQTHIRTKTYTHKHI